MDRRPRESGGHSPPRLHGSPNADITQRQKHRLGGSWGREKAVPPHPGECAPDPLPHGEGPGPRYPVGGVPTAETWGDSLRTLSVALNTQSALTFKRTKFPIIHSFVLK